MTFPKSSLLKLLENFPQTQAIKRTLLSTWKIFKGQGAREGYLAAVDQGIISLSNFLATLLLARNVSPTELGVYGVGFTSLRLLRAFQEGLTIQPLNAYGAGLSDQEFKQYASNTTLLQTLMACFCGKRHRAAWMDADRDRQRHSWSWHFFTLAGFFVVAVT